MQALDKRHEDRARRKADNRAERGNDEPGVSVGSVINAFREFATLRGRLSDGDREKLETRMADIDLAEFEASPSLAEAEDGNTMAGIGVVNTKVVPAGKGVKRVEKLQASDLDVQGGENLNGKALNEQLGDEAWGTTGSPSSADLKAADKDADKGADKKGK
jgi:hypothetical protein